MHSLLPLVFLILGTTTSAQHVAPFARDLGEAHSILALDDGTILVSRPSTFDVIALRDRDGDGTADEMRTAVSSVEGASGLAIHDGTLFVAGSKCVVAAERLPDGSFGAWHEILGDLPNTATTRRPLAIGADGRLYLGVSEHGALWQIERTGLTRRVYARGLGTIGAISFDDKGSARAAAKNEPSVTFGESTFTLDPKGTILRTFATPPAMTSSAPEPTRAILAKAFAVGDLRGATAVLHDEEQDVYFVSGTGYIARLSPEGKVLEHDFIKVEAPRGMAIHGVDLWLVDGKLVRVFNRVTGHEVRAIDLAEHGAVRPDHVAIGPDDSVYVTDSDRGTGNGRIFRIEPDGDVEIAFEGEELRSPAGIAWDGTRFLIAQAYGNEILGWQPGHAPTAVLRGPGAYDGLAILPNGIVIAASHNDDALHFGTTGDLRPLFSRGPTPAGIAFDRKRNRLLIPSTEGNWLEGWTLPPMAQPAPRTAKERSRDTA